MRDAEKGVIVLPLALQERGIIAKKRVRRSFSPFSFPREVRLHKKKEFDLVYEQGKKLFCRDFILFITENEGPLSRLGVTVSKKVSKRANKRNRIKRTIREIFRLNRVQITGSYDLVVVAHKRALELSYHETHEQIIGKLRSKGILRKEQ